MERRRGGRDDGIFNGGAGDRGRTQTTQELIEILGVEKVVKIVGHDGWSGRSVFGNVLAVLGRIVDKRGSDRPVLLVRIRGSRRDRGDLSEGGQGLSEDGTERGVAQEIVEAGVHRTGGGGVDQVLQDAHNLGILEEVRPLSGLALHLGREEDHEGGLGVVGEGGCGRQHRGELGDGGGAARGRGDGGGGGGGGRGRGAGGRHVGEEGAAGGQTGDLVLDYALEVLCDWKKEKVKSLVGQSEGEYVNVLTVWILCGQLLELRVDVRRGSIIEEGLLFGIWWSIHSLREEERKNNVIEVSFSMR